METFMLLAGVSIGDPSIKAVRVGVGLKTIR